MTFSIAISGKGGTGKTTIAALLTKVLGEKVKGPLLLVDADPNSNLNEALGVEVERTVGDVREKFIKEKDTLPPEQVKEEYLKYLIQTSILELEDFDLIVMGRPEGPGCYCYINNVLRKILDSIPQYYPLVLMDTEAGLEHFSRRTTHDVDVLLVTTDLTVSGAVTAKRIKKLCSQLHINIGKIFLIVNRVPSSMGDKVDEVVRASEVECVGIIPEDPFIQQFNAEGKPLLDLPQNSPSLKAIEDLVDKLLLPMLKA